MKKLFYILGIGLLMASCTEDFKDWADPMSNSESSKSANAVVNIAESIDFTAVTTDSIILFSPNYSMGEGVVAKNNVYIYNEDKSEFAEIAADEQGRVSSAELRAIIEKFYGVYEGGLTVPINIETILTDNGEAFSFNNGLDCAVNMAAGMYLYTTSDKIPMALYDGNYTVTIDVQDIRFFFLPFYQLQNVANGRLGSDVPTDGLLMGGDLVKGSEANEIFFEADDEYTQYVITMNEDNMTYEVEGIVQANPTLWYMVGNCIGSNDWDNGASSVGTGLIPLLPEPGAELTVDGSTTLVYAGYFPAGGQFKFIKTPGDWGAQMNYTNIENPDASVVSDEDGDNHNIGIVSSGYHKITMNTIDGTVKIEKYTGSVRIFSTITMPGDYQGWNAGGNAMTAMGKRPTTETHDWYADMSFGSNAQLKFANGSWDINWGAPDFPMGYGVQGGDNIPVAAGDYRVFFNDILGLYYFQPDE